MEIAKKVLEELIKIDTSIPEGNESKACEYLAELFWEKAVKVEKIGEFPRENIIAYFGNLYSDNILIITGHLDVAPSNTATWKTNPYEPYEENGKIFGRGSCDMKGGLAISIEAIFRALENGFLKDKLVIFAGTVDEETGASSEMGAKLVSKYLKEKNIKPFGVILPEPNNDYKILKVNIGHRGVIWLECQSKGKTMHPGSSVHNENNAIINMYKFINEVNMEIPRNPIIKDGIVGNSCRVTHINSGLEGQYKFVPDKCICNLDIRVSPLSTNEKIMNIISEIAKNNDIDVRCIRQANSSIIDKDEKIVKFILNILEEEKQAYEVCCASPVCDAHWFNEQGMKTVNTLGVSGGNVHVNDEFAMLDSFEKRINILIKILKEF